MIAGSPLHSRFRLAVTVALLTLFGTMAFSMPAMKSPTTTEPMQVPEPATAATSAVQGVAAVMAPAPAPAVGMATEVAAPVLKPVANKPAMAREKSTIVPVAAKTVAANEVIEADAPATTAVLTVAMAATVENVSPGNDAGAAVETESVVTIDAKPETYADWNAIQTLAKTAAAARDAGVKSITTWNSLAETCGIPPQRYSRLDLNFSKSACREIDASIKDVGQIYSFWQQCVAFIKTHNRLAINFSRAEASKFVDRSTVGNELKKSYQALSEFCNTDVYKRRYPKMLTLIFYSGYSQAAVASPGSTYVGSIPGYYSAYSNGRPPEN